MKKLLSYSLFQIDPKENAYIQTMLASKEILDELYPDWIRRVYIGDTVRPEVYNVLEKWGYELIVMPHNHYAGTFWRFLPFWDDTIDIWLCKDADCIPSYTERAAEIEWEQSDKGFIRTEWYTDDARDKTGLLWWIAAAYMGSKRQCNEIISANIPREHIEGAFKYNAFYAHDERWLYDHVRPLIEDNVFSWAPHHEFTHYGLGMNGKQVYYIKKVIPPFDSVSVRHNLISMGRQIGCNHDDIDYYYRNNIITRFAATEEILQQRGLQVLTGDTQR